MLLLDTSDTVKGQRQHKDFTNRTKDVHALCSSDAVPCGTHVLQNLPTPPSNDNAVHNTVQRRSQRIKKKKHSAAIHTD